MRTPLLLLALVAALAACDPPREARDEPRAPPAPPCNLVEPDLARLVAVTDPIAGAAAVADLRGGRIAPGTYDLVSATRVGQPTGWQGVSTVAIEVAETDAGEVTFNWAGVRNGQSDRWTATFAEAPEPSLTFTCGRIGHVGAVFAMAGDQLSLRLPDGANGALDLVFVKRAA